MKKFLSVFSFAVMALVAAVSFTSCTNDDKNDPILDENYLCFKYWVSNDVLDIADINVTGMNISFIGEQTFTDPNNVKHVGKESQLVEFIGSKATNANFSISFTLKPNWQEILSKKETFDCYHSYGLGKKKGSGAVVGTNLIGGSLKRGSDRYDFDESVPKHISNLKYTYSK